jgi:hypothetical protein
MDYEQQQEIWRSGGRFAADAASDQTGIKFPWN